MIKQQSTRGFESVTTVGPKSHASTAGIGSHAITTGFGSHSSTAGNWAHSSTAGDKANASAQGRNSIAAALGMASRAKAGDGGWIVLAAYSEDCALLHVRAGQVGKDVKPNVWYSLSREGQFIEHQEAQQGGQPA